MKLFRMTAAALALAACASVSYADNHAGKNPIVGGKEMFPTKNIIQNAVNSADHTTLVAAVKAAGLVDTLQGPGPFTVFAPTDRAFAASNAGSLDREALQRLVAYHVVPGQLTEDFLEGMDVNHATLLGSSLNVDGSGGELRVNGAGVVRANLAASNGVVYAIDRVLTPR